MTLTDCAQNFRALVLIRLRPPLSVVVVVVVLLLLHSRPPDLSWFSSATALILGPRGPAQKHLRRKPELRPISQEQESDRSLIPLRMRNVFGWEHGGDHSSMELSKCYAYVDDLMAVNITSHELMSCVLRVRVSLYCPVYCGEDQIPEASLMRPMSVDCFTY